MSKQSTIFLATLAAQTAVSAHASGNALDDILKQQRLRGSYGGWVLSSGKTVDAHSYCALDAGVGQGTMTFRVVSGQSGQVEWQLNPQAEQAPPSAVVTVMTSIGDKPVLTDFTVIKPGATQELQNKYWFQTQGEDFNGFVHAINSLAAGATVTANFPNTGMPPIILGGDGLKDAMPSLMGCVQSMQ